MKALSLLDQAIEDALQTTDNRLRAAALQFLEVCAPTAAEEVRCRMGNKPYIGLEVRITPGADENIEVVVTLPPFFPPSPSTSLYRDLWDDVKELLDERMMENGYVFAGESSIVERGDGIQAKNVLFLEYSYLFLCKDCRQDIYELKEYYMVHNDIWAEAAPEMVAPGRGCLCVGCLENRLGRQLIARDFTRCEANYFGTKSQRLKKRMTTIWEPA